MEINIISVKLRCVHQPFIFLVVGQDIPAGADPGFLVRGFKLNNFAKGGSIWSIYQLPFFS